MGKIEMDKINEILERINNLIGEEDLGEIEIPRLMRTHSNLGGKVIYGSVIDPDRYVKAADVIKEHEFK